MVEADAHLSFAISTIHVSRVREGWYAHPHSSIIPSAGEDGMVRRMPRHRIHSPGSVGVERGDLGAGLAAPDVDA